MLENHVIGLVLITFAMNSTSGIPINGTQLQFNDNTIKKDAQLKLLQYEECQKHFLIKGDVKNEKCKNGEASMQKAFQKLEYLFNDIKGLLDITEFSSIYSDLEQLEYVEQNGKFPTYGNPSCLIFNRTLQRELSLCPWHYKLIYRIDRYPHFQTQARCNCMNCSNLNTKAADFTFQCKPLIKLQPALVRAKLVDGLYVWKPALEQVAVACACMRNEKNISFKTMVG
jgi:hypothetical protein